MISITQDYVENVLRIKPDLQKELAKRYAVVPVRASEFMVGNIRNEDRGGYIEGRRYIHQIP